MSVHCTFHDLCLFRCLFQLLKVNFRPKGWKLWCISFWSFVMCIFQICSWKHYLFQYYDIVLLFSTGRGIDFNSSFVSPKQSTSEIQKFTVKMKWFKTVQWNWASQSGILHIIGIGKECLFSEAWEQDGQEVIFQIWCLQQQKHQSPITTALEEITLTVKDHSFACCISKDLDWSEC